MTQFNQQIDSKDLQEKHAVHRLLQMAQKRSYVEEQWNSREKKTVQKVSQTKLPPASKSSDRRNIKINQNPELLMKQIQKQRLKQLIQDTINNEQQSKLFQPKIIQQPSQNQIKLTMKFLKNAKLRPFNSNMTFYHLKKDDREKIINSSLTFYQNENKKNDQNSNHDRTNSFRILKSNQVKLKDRYQHKQQGDTQSNIVYFKPNKSQTVRQLLNQMKIQKIKHNDVILNSTKRNFKEEFEQSEDINYLNEHQLKIMSRYKKFIPFQKDQHLLFKKISQGENIWMQKFKQSWHRQKHQLEGKKCYFKKLIVND